MAAGHYNTAKRATNSPLAGNLPLTEPTKHHRPETTLHLKDPALAALLAFLVPGLGHLYQGRTAKAILFFVCLMGTFVWGCYLGGSREMGWGRVVYMSWRDDDTRLAFICQAGIGLPAFPALVQAIRTDKNPSRPPIWNGLMAPPLSEIPGTESQTADAQTRKGLREERQKKYVYTVDELNLGLASYFDLGTVYTMFAGLLNILAIYDAWGGPVFPETKEEDEKEEPKGDGGQDEGVTG